jgi:uncharacterized protein
MIKEVEQKRAEVAELCRRFRVRELKIFGSAVTGTYSPENSDLDFVAEFADTQTTDYPNRYLDFAESLEQLFHRPVDLVTRRSLRNPYFRAEVERTAQVVYEDHR